MHILCRFRDIACRYWSKIANFHALPTFTALVVCDALKISPHRCQKAAMMD